MANLRCIFDRRAYLPSYMQWEDAISCFCRTEGFAFLADRFGYLNQFTRIRAAAISQGSFPKSDSNQTFADCMRKRVSTILTDSAGANSQIHIMWSGGCDSTGVVSAFLEQLDSRDRLNVLYTASSLLEYHEFFTYLQSIGVPTQLLQASELIPTALTYAKRGDIVLTGFPADQLFGSIIGQSWAGDTTKDHWTEYLKRCVKKYDVANQQYEAAFAHYGIPVSTVAEFLWFNNFALKWDFVCYPALITHTETHDNIVPFYQHRIFEDWSLSNFDWLHAYDQKDPANYKLPLKSYIYDVTKMSSVFALRKVPSLAYADRIDDKARATDIATVAAIDDENYITVVHLPVANKYWSTAARDGYACASIMRRYLKK